MTEPATTLSSATHPLEMILRLCAAATPPPWYPSDYAKATGTVRDELDPHLNRLRLGGLITLTDWVKGRGQGYVLTPEGTRLLGSPHELAQLGKGQMPEVRPAVDVPANEVSRDEWDRAGSVFDNLLTPQTAVVTNFLLTVNIVWFLAGVFLAHEAGITPDQYFKGPPKDNNALAHQYSEVIHRLGALSSADLVHGQWWRLLTCCFVHYGLVHLIVNMVSLLFVGWMAERMWGRARYLAIYLIAGLGGSCIIMVVTPMSQVAGASGALWGIMAATAVWIMLNRSYLPPQVSSVWLRNLLVVFMLNAFLSMGPHVGAAAHFGGGFTGGVAAVLANFDRSASLAHRRLGWIALVIFPILFIAGLVGDMAIDSRWQPAYQMAEQTDFVTEFRDPVTITAEATLEVYIKEAKSLLEQNATRRDPAAVTQCSSALAAKQQALEGVARQLQQTGPYRTSPIESARELALHYMNTLIEVCRLARKCLETGANRQDENDLAKHLKDTDSLRREWNQLVGYRTTFNPFGKDQSR